MLWLLETDDTLRCRALDAWDERGDAGGEMDEGRIPGAKDVWGIKMAGAGMAEMFLDRCCVNVDVLLSVPGRVIMTGVGGVL